MSAARRTVLPLFAAIAFALAPIHPARAQDTPQLPPPPPPSSTPQYSPPPTPQYAPSTPQTTPPSRRERERETAPARREKEREREREHEREREREAAPPPRPRYLPPPPPPSRDEPPPARRWFQLALRTGISVAGGAISGDPGDSMTRDFAPQVPIFIELGAKVHPMIFLGAYTALSFGGAGSTFQNNEGCAGGSSRSCVASEFRIGVEVQVHFRPAERINPWVGYGLGFESASVSASGGGTPQVSESFTGLEAARLSGGVDFRLSRWFGIGPFLDLDFGSYSHENVQGIQTTNDGGIKNTALHEWFTIGLRGVLFP